MDNFYDLEKALLKAERDTQHGYLSFPALFRHYEIKCYKMLFGAFEFTGFPEEWDYDYVLDNIFRGGMVGICSTPLGVLPLQCGLTGLNVFSHPTTAIFANPVLGNFERDLFSDNPKDACALVRLQYNYTGCGHLIDKYASQLAEIDNSISINLKNTKVAQIFFADSKQQAATLQEMYRQIDSGKPVVAVKSDALTPEGVYYNHVRESFIAQDLQLLKADIINEFLTDIGLNNTNYQKRERLIVDEVNANNDEIKSNVQHWLDTMREGLDRANAVFGLNLGVELRQFDKRKGDAENDSDETKNIV